MMVRFFLLFSFLFLEVSLLASDVSTIDSAPTSDAEPATSEISILDWVRKKKSLIDGLWRPVYISGEIWKNSSHLECSHPSMMRNPGGDANFEVPLLVSDEQETDVEQAELYIEPAILGIPVEPKLLTYQPD